MSSPVLDTWRVRTESLAALARDWLFEPAEVSRRLESAHEENLDFDGAPEEEAGQELVRPVVAVVGLASRCGSSTVARWLAAALAERDPGGAAVLSGPHPRGTGGPRSRAVGRLARELSERSIGPVRTAGRLCLVESGRRSDLEVAASYLAPLVIDVGHGVPPAPAASLADHVVLVASPAVEPALASVVAASIARSGPEPMVAVNRLRGPGSWEDRPAFRLPESRLAARRAAGGREPGGPLRATVRAIADACEEIAWR